MFAHDIKVTGHSLTHASHTRVVALGGGDTAGQVGTPRPIRTVVGTLDDDYVPVHRDLRVRRACLRMLCSVPGGNVSLGLPATVAVPGLFACR